MLKKTYELCSGLRATIIGGISLALSLLLWIVNIDLLIDPAWIAVIICGYPLLYLAIFRLIHNKGITKISSALLISIAMIAAIFIGELFAAGQVAFIMAIGGILEARTVRRATKGIRQLISLVPEQGRVIRDNTEYMVATLDIKQGDILRVLPGEAIPVDGKILSGDTSVDQSIMTGESLPIDKSVGDDVFCGTINHFGAIDIQATKVGEDSSLQKLIRLVQEAELNKAPMQLIVDKWAAWLVPLCLLIATSTYLITGNIIIAVTVMIVFCPCALALATPTSIMAAIGQATKHGVIIKSGAALERMGKVDVIAFDKTGTLTHGNLRVSDVITFDKAETLTHDNLHTSDVISFDKTETLAHSDLHTSNVISLGQNLSKHRFLTLAASVESHSEHPLGRATVAYAKTEGITLEPIENFAMVPGKGVRAEVNGVQVLCGSHTYLQECAVSLDEEVNTTLATLRSQGKATILLAYDNVCKGIIALSDTLRDTAGSMVQELRATGTDAVLLTGDNMQTAQYFSEQIGIRSIHAELLPADKVKQIETMQSDGHKVCMIGDGVNDAPALKTANVGVAMGTMGSDIAIEAADIALMGDDIAKIPYLKRLANAAIGLIQFNIIIAIVFNIIAIILSIMGVLGPITGALAHNISSVLVVLNAARLYDKKI